MKRNRIIMLAVVLVVLVAISATVIMIKKPDLTEKRHPCRIQITHTSVWISGKKHTIRY